MTDTAKLVEVVCAGSELTALVGWVVSISQEVDERAAAGIAVGVGDAGREDRCGQAVPSAVVSPARPLMSYVLPETRARVTPLVIATGLLLSVRVTVPAPNELALTGMLNVTAIVETGVFRGLGVIAAIEVTVTGERIWTVC